MALLSEDVFNAICAMTTEQLVHIKGLLSEAIAKKNIGEANIYHKDDAPETDPLRFNKYRLQYINPTMCMGRRINSNNPIPGTRPGDKGSSGKIYPELQCTRKPIEGDQLCELCAKKEDDVKRGMKIPTWYGRLDETIYDTAPVVGSKMFFLKYPYGIPPDIPVSIEMFGKMCGDVIEANKDGIAPAEPKPPVAKRTRKTPKKKKDEFVAAAEPLNKIKWIKFNYNKCSMIRHSINNNVYEYDEAAEEPIQRDKFVGKWMGGGEIDLYADEEEEDDN